MTLTERLRRKPADKGSGAIALILAALLFMTIAGFVIDTGLAIHQRERAADTAEQAARYAADHINATSLRNGTGVSVDAQACTANVEAFVAESGYGSDDVSASHCTAAGGNSVSVTVRLTYKPLLMSMVNSGNLQVWGSATAQAVQEQ
ncbi:pilus assembly protein TadG-related protein [Kitasatospora sp. RB6PN24]|uniref:pilus assembly protein TadG-related protein n=1 Tax=Kitasatospora humi TaxID=2893891 RepID=UPI001E3FD8B0|nr:pilus assembly protein TadG-related protein [Kitasatospora humi]MCC9309960.1 pilus assembly protein TadG-related protein [Kitasatospora humi]